MYEAFAEEERSLVVVNAFSLNPGERALNRPMAGFVPVCLFNGVTQFILGYSTEYVPFFYYLGDMIRAWV